MATQRRPQRPKYVRFVQELRRSSAAQPHGNSKYNRNVKYRPQDPEDWEERYDV